MEWKREEYQGVLVLVPPYEALDVTVVQSFKKEMAARVENHSQVVLDLSSVQFVDSAGCGAILSCLRQINQKSGELKVCNVQKGVQTLFELVRMHRILEFYPTRKEALASFQH